MGFMNLKIVVVVFNIEMKNSPTLLSLVKQKTPSFSPAELIIYDNSFVSVHDYKVINDLKDEFVVYYKHTPQNLTLREIYNLEIKKIRVNDYILLLDDDTDLPANYLMTSYSYINRYPEVNLFSPLIYVHDKLYSPHRSYSYVNMPLTNVVVGVVSTKNRSVINSGIIVAGRYFIKSGFLYPDFVDFYGTDRVFFDHYASLNEDYCIMNVRVQHDVSNHPQNSSIEDYSRVLNRVNVFWIKYLSHQNKSAFLYKLFMLLYALKISLQRRNVIFLKSAIKLGCENEK